MAASNACIHICTEPDLASLTAGLATNLHKHLHDQGSALHVWNRTSSKAKPLLAAGAQQLGAPAEAAQGEGSITFSMLFDGEAPCYSCTPGSDASFAQLSDAGFPQAALVLLSWAWLLHRRSHSGTACNHSDTAPLLRAACRCCAARQS